MSGANSRRTSSFSSFLSLSSVPRAEPRSVLTMPRSEERRTPIAAWPSATAMSSPSWEKAAAPERRIWLATWTQSGSLPASSVSQCQQLVLDALAEAIRRRHAAKAGRLILGLVRSQTQVGVVGVAEIECWGQHGGSPWDEENELSLVPFAGADRPQKRSLQRTPQLVFEPCEDAFEVEVELACERRCHPRVARRGAGLRHRASPGTELWRRASRFRCHHCCRASRRQWCRSPARRQRPR